MSLTNCVKLMRVFKINVGPFAIKKLLLSLQFYSRNNDSIVTTLTKPKKKQGAKSAEVELCKSKL